MADHRRRQTGDHASGASRPEGAGVWPLVKRILCVLLLLCAFVLSVRTTALVSDSLFDSDTSSELILSEKLSREGGIMSDSWYYSTELQVVDCQIVYKLLFYFTQDWSLVRFWGALIMQLLLLGAFGFLSRQARISFNRFCLTGAAMLLPFSVAWGRIVLYHSYYSFHLIMANLTVGLYLGAARRFAGEEARSAAAAKTDAWLRWVYMALLFLVSWTAGLEGVRQMMVCTVPLLAASLLSAMVGEGRSARDFGSHLRAAAPSLLLAAGTLVFSGLGYLVNLKFLSLRYNYTDYSSQYVSLYGVGQLETVFRAFLTTLGYHNATELFSLHGLLGISSFLVWLVSVFLGLHTLLRTEDPAARFLSLFMFMTHLVLVCVFMLLVLEDFEIELYFLPVTFWILPALAKADLRPRGGVALPGEEKLPLRRRLTAGDAPLSVHGLISLLLLVILLVNGVYYTGFFRDPVARGREIEYTGLRYNDTANVEALRPVADYLAENGYTLVYASYWNAAVITELTDGLVKSLPVEAGTRKHPIRYFNWLSDAALRQVEVAEKQKAAILASMDLESGLEEDNKYGAVPLETFGALTVYDLPDPAALARDLAE